MIEKINLKFPSFRNPLVLVGFLVIGLFAVGYLAFQSSNFNLAARVNSRNILKADYETRMNSQQKYEKEYQKANFDNEDGKKKLLALKKQILDQMIEEEIIIEEAKKRGISVTDSDLNAEYGNMAKANGGEDKLNTLISNYYGYNKEQFMRFSVTSKVWRQKLQQEILASDDILKEARIKADELAQKIKDGAKFEEIAQKNSQDAGSAARGGDLGLIEKGKMVVEFEKVAFELRAGEVSQVFKTVYGYHIVKKLEADKDGKAHVAQILIKTQSFSEWLAEKVKGAKVETFVKF
ncbi:MAG: peptidylprolyl isomerase [Patescibacteria group bacterium]|nr:peptidylprolyl isomerase [Patescibacteria group bacterium]MCL5093669.1 peptidylprolyl isomerase [Patescibacteria group bacterium]